MRCERNYHKPHFHHQELLKTKFVKEKANDEVKDGDYSLPSNFPPRRQLSPVPFLLFVVQKLFLLVCQELVGKDFWGGKREILLVGLLVLFGWDRFRYC